MGIIAIAGTVLTGYLTLAELTGGNVACPTGGCDQVLASPYASIFGLPLTLFGCLAYLTMAGLSLGPFLVNPQKSKGLRTTLEQRSWPLLFIGATAMVWFSGYLMYILFAQIQETCLYCLGSALFSLLLFVLTITGRTWDDAGQLFFTGVIVTTMTLVVTFGVYTSANPSATLNGNSGPPTTTTSGPAEVALATHLKQINAKKYGAYWCPHCHEQKELFGAEAFELIDYVECDPEGIQPKPEQCQIAQIESYPTWEINGQLYRGIQPLECLAQRSGYTGLQNFQRQPDWFNGRC